MKFSLPFPPISRRPVHFLFECTVEIRHIIKSALPGYVIDFIFGLIFKTVADDFDAVFIQESIKSLSRFCFKEGAECGRGHINGGGDFSESDFIFVMFEHVFVNGLHTFHILRNVVEGVNGHTYG